MREGDGPENDSTWTIVSNDEKGERTSERTCKDEYAPILDLHMPRKKPTQLLNLFVDDTKLGEETVLLGSYSSTRRCISGQLNVQGYD